MKHSIGKKITCSFLLLSAVPLLVSGLFISWRVYTNQRQQAVELQREVAKRVSNELLILLHEHEDKFTLASKIYDLPNLPAEKCQTILSQIRSHKDEKHQDIIDDLALLDQSGTLLAYASRLLLVTRPDLGDWLDTKLLQSALQSPRIQYSPVKIRAKTGEPFIVIFYPIVDYQNGGNKALLVARLRLAWFFDRIVHLPIGKSGIIYITDQTGKVIAHPNPSTILSETSIDLTDSGILSDIGGEKVLRVIESITIGDQSFFVITDRPLGQAMSLAAETISAISAFLLLFIIGAAVLGVFAARRITSPIASLAQTALAITAGDLNCKAKINEDNELGLLAQAFNSMLERLIQDLKKREKVEKELLLSHLQLEERIEARTAELRDSNRLLHRQMSERLQMEKALQKLLAFSKSLSSTTEISALYRKTTQVSKELLHLDFSTLMLLTKDKKALVIEDTIGFPEESIGTFSLLAGQGLSTYVVQEKKAATVLDFATESRFEIPSLVHEKNISSALCVPMILDEEVFGVLIGHTVRQTIFSEEELSLYQSFANQAAVAINNALHLCKLRESEEKFRTFFDNANDAILIYDMQGKLFEVNKIACERLGYSRDQLLAMPVTKLIGEPFVKTFHCRLKAIRKENDSIFEIALRGSDGAEIPIEMSCKSIEFEGQQAILAIARDISERKKAEEELIKAKKLESIGILAGGIAHDFNNILTAIVGNLGLAALTTKGDDEIHPLLKEAEKASLRAKDLTQQLLTFSKGGEPVKELASIAEIVRESASFILRGSNIRCDFKIADDLWPASIDTAQMSQVIQNLIINASQSMPEGGVIEVECRNVERGNASSPLSHIRRQDCVRISIKDNGIGIPARILDRIFDPYFTTKQGGSGLGLAVTHSIIKKHGGHISVSSVAGEGSTFTIYLPASPHEQLAKTAQERAVTKKGSGKIMVMDDEQMVRTIATAMLRHLGYETVEASDGGQAIELFEEHRKSGRPIDLAIFDLTVPGGVGGKEALEELRKRDPQVKVIVSSGYSNDETMANYKQYGFSGVLGKPFQLQQLSDILTSVLG